MGLQPQFSRLHLWMGLLLVLSQLGIFYFYWPTFLSKSWEIHIHYWLVTLWYCLVVIQPYLVTHNRASSHRTLGLFGFVLAGGVIFTALSLLDIPLRLVENYDVSRPGPPVAFYYRILISEFFSILAFAVAVIGGILWRKDPENHAWWLIASAFYMIMPALGRGSIVFWRAILSPEDFKAFMGSGIGSGILEIVYLSLFLVFVHKFGKWRHMATYIGIALIIVRYISGLLGSNENIQAFLHRVIVW